MLNIVVLQITATDDQPDHNFEATAGRDKFNQPCTFQGMMRVLTKCHSINACLQDECVTHIRCRVAQIMERLVISKSYGLNKNCTKQVSGGVLKGLQNMFNMTEYISDF